MANEQTWSLRAEMDAITDVAVSVHHAAQSVLGEDHASDVELALVEVLTNIIRHGYGDGPGQIEVCLVRHPDGVQLIVSDRGKSIPPGLLEAAQIDGFSFDIETLEGLPEGGMGLPLIVMLMSDVTYTHADGRNILSMFRRRGSTA
ncbi:MAG: ATP-binding protein [Pseudomonadota bacterium]